MEKQIIITLGREFGSAGHEIGEKLSERLGISFYDRKMLDELAEKYKVDHGLIEKYDEKIKKPFFSRTVRGMSNSLEDLVFDMQSNFIKEKANSGESFILVGRCGEMLLGDREGHMSIFVLGDKEEKINRIVELYSLSRDDAYEKMRRHDKKRKAYHNSRCEGKWGDSRTYDLCVNSSRLGVEGTVDFLIDYINRRIAGLK